MTLGERIKSCRQELDMGVKEVAEITGISPNSIWLYEADKSDPSLFNAMCIAKALGVSLDYLAGLTDEKFIK